MSIFEPIEDPVMMFLRDVRDSGLENSSVRRYYAKYEGVVTSNQDPTNQGRVQVRVFILKRPQPIDLWAYPSSPYAGADRGFFFPPHVGDLVWVWFDHGNVEVPGISGGWWAAPRKTAESSNIPNEFKHGVLPPTKRGIKTAKGHALIFCDNPINPYVEIWSGTQGASGTDAIKNARLFLSDLPGFQRAILDTLLGHSLTLVDQPAPDGGAFLKTVSNVRLRLFNATRQLLADTPGRRSLILDDLNTLTGLFGLTGALTIDDAAQETSLSSQGKLILSSQTDTEITTAGNKTINTIGKHIENIHGGLALTVLGTSTMTFLAGLTLATTGAAIIGGALAIAASLTVGVAVLAGVTLGAISAGIFYRLVTQAFIVLYNANVVIHNANVAAFAAHTHPLTALGIGNLGAPVVSTGFTLPPTTAQTPVAPANLDATTTFTTVAN